MTDQRSSGTAGLLPCPLCNSEAQLGACWIGERNLSEEPAVRCLTCGCRATLAAWNTRSTPPIEQTEAERFTSFAADLASKQQPLGDDFAKALAETPYLTSPRPHIAVEADAIGVLSQQLIDESRRTGVDPYTASLLLHASVMLDRLTEDSIIRSTLAAGDGHTERTKWGIIDWKMEVERLNRLLAQAGDGDAREGLEAKAAVAYLIDHIEYSDSYGVEGSSFQACLLCTGGGSPGRSLVHDEQCPVRKCESIAAEWVEELYQDRADVVSQPQAAK